MLQDMLKQKMNSIRTQNADDVLAALGLERRRSALEITGWTAAILATGIAIGAGAALLMTPKTGRALRRDIRTRVEEIAEKISDKAEETVHDVRAALSSEEDGKNQGNKRREEGAHRRS